MRSCLGNSAKEWVVERSNMNPTALGSMLVSTDAQQEENESHLEGLEGASGTVLVVIENGDESRQLASALQNQGCEVLPANDWSVALQIARSRRPNLILFEVSRPQEDGFAVCSSLRDDDRLRHIPVILLARGLGAEEKLRGLKLGAVDYIDEPFDWAEVAAQACSLLKLERVRRDLQAANLSLMSLQAQHQAELTAAASFQKSLLPPKRAEKFEGVSVSWHFMPADQVGGDLLGYTWLDEDHLAAYVVDVCGHGLSAAMLTAAISISLAPTIGSAEGSSTKWRSAFSPKQVLEALDREYPLERFERPFTISYLVLNCKTGEFRCSRAGHPMPIIVRKGGQLESIEAGGTIIGLGRMLPFDESAGRLNYGDSIILYSDGVTECANESATFGVEGLCRVLQECWGTSPEIICEKVVAGLVQFNGGAAMHDDVTMLALTYGSGPNLAIKKPASSGPLELAS
jgi:phosphoserine phosphatase RsbU/P